MMFMKVQQKDKGYWGRWKIIMELKIESQIWTNVALGDIHHKKY